MTSFPSSLPAFLASRGATVVDIPILQPADPFLDTAGEGLRGRIFLTENEKGEALCLRPEFTIPVCLEHLRGGADTKRYGYCGEVFRQRREGGSAFVQAGIEDIGEADRATADARSIADALALLESAAPGRRWQITLGDQSVFEAAVKALGLPRGWRKKLARAFGAPDQLEALIAALGAPRGRANGNGVPVEMAKARDKGGTAALAALVAGRMEDFGYAAATSRTPSEIAQRMVEQAALDNARLTKAHIGDLRDFLSISVPLGEAGAALKGFAKRLGSDEMNGVIAAFEKRTDEIGSRGVPLETIAYNAAFGRPLDYYTGLVYEIGVADRDGPPVVGGGRYDRLLTLLGAKSEIPGVGFSVWLDRLAAASGEGAR